MRNSVARTWMMRVTIFSHRALQRRFALGPRAREAWAETGLQAEDHAQRPQLSAPETGHHLAGHPELSLLGLEAGRHGAVWQHSQGA